MRKKVLFIAVTLAVIFGLLPALAGPVLASPGTTYYVATTGSDTTGDGSSGNPWATIGHAISHAATSGDTISVAAGTYDEQVVIDKSLTLQGDGDTTIVKPSSAAKLSQVFNGLYSSGGTKNIAGIIVANVSDGSSVTVKNLKVDESAVATKPAGADYLAGIFYRETGGTVDSVSVVGGGAWSGGDRAYGMYLSAGTNTVTVEVKGSTITNFDKEGINAEGNKLTVNIHHNTITGRGPTLVGDEVQNGVDIGRDAVGTVNYNTISNLEYGPKTWWAAGVMFYHYVTPTGKSATANNNTITNCQIGIMFKNANATAQDNIVSGGTVGLAGIHAQPNYAGAYTASFVHNTVSGITDYSAIDAETFATLTPGTGATLTATISNNTLTGGYGLADGVYIGGSAGSVTATISDNTISGWPEHGINLGDACVAGATITGNTITNNVGSSSGVHIDADVNATNVAVNYNIIVGNLNYGVYNGDTVHTLNAENNWWGSAGGPGSGGANDVYGLVDYDPLLGPPTVTGVSPATGNKGQELAVTITGTNFAGTTVSFGASITVNSFTVVSDTTITASITIDGAAVTGARTVTVTTAAGTGTLTSGFTVTAPAAPTVGTVTPNHGCQGEASLTVTITGTFFDGTLYGSLERAHDVTTVSFGTGISVNSFTVDSSTTITTNISIDDATITGSRDVTVTTPGGTFTKTSGFTVTLPAPTVDSVSPNSGYKGEVVVGITITGTNFTGATTVDFGASIDTDSFTVVSNTEITASITIGGAAITGSRDVTVTTPWFTATKTSGFTVNAPPAPTVATVSPASGNQGQTDLTVTITGTNFAVYGSLSRAHGVTTVSFGADITVNSFTVDSDTQITVSISIAIDADLGARDVTVTNPGGIVTHGFTVNRPPAPTLTGVAPNKGYQGQANLTVTITGTNFDDATTLISISFGADITVNSFTVDSSTQITANISIGGAAVIGSRDVTVTIPGGTATKSSGFTVTVHLAPRVFMAMPLSGNQGQAMEVGIIGAYFDGFTDVSLGAGIRVVIFVPVAPIPEELIAALASAMSVPPEQVIPTIASILGVTPADVDMIGGMIVIDPAAVPGARNVSVTTPGGTGGAVVFGVTPPPAPTVDTVAPASGNQGQASLTVTITGTNFDSGTLVLNVSFGADITVNSFTVVSDTEITATITIAVDADLGLRDVSVENPGGTGTKTGGFTVTLSTAPPTVTAVAPNHGCQGQASLSVVITGTNFTGAIEVNFGAQITVNSFTVDTSTQITASITIDGVAVTGSRNVSVTTPYGTGTKTSGFTVTLPAPTVTAVSPAYDVQGATLDVALTGANFDWATTVSFGAGITVNGFTVVSSIKITVSITISASATVDYRDVSVTTPGGSGTLEDAFTVLQAQQVGCDLSAKVPPLMRIVSSRTSIDFGDIMPGDSSTLPEEERTIDLHNTGSVNAWLTTEITGDAASFYMANLTLDAPQLAKDYAAVMLCGDADSTVAQLSVPEGTIEGMKTGRIIFWAQVLIPFTLTTAVDGIGTTSPAVGPHDLPQQMTVSITATAAAGNYFVGWTVSAGENVASPTAASTTVKLDMNKTVTAHFLPVPHWNYLVTYGPDGGPVNDTTHWTQLPVGTEMKNSELCARVEGIISEGHAVRMASGTTIWLVGTTTWNSVAYGKPVYVEATVWLAGNPALALTQMMTYTYSGDYLTLHDVGQTWSYVLDSTSSNTALSPPSTVTYDVQVIDTESVTVPAGTFTCFRVETRIHSSGALYETQWFDTNPDLTHNAGLVQQRMEAITYQYPETQVLTYAALPSGVTYP